MFVFDEVSFIKVMLLNANTKSCFLSWKGSSATLFLDADSEKISLKLRQSINSKNGTREYICFSIKSGNLIVYHWKPKNGLYNINYQLKDLIKFIAKLVNRAYYGKGNILDSEAATQTIHQIINCLAIELSNLLQSQISYLTIAQDLAYNIFPLCYQYRAINPLYSPRIVLKGMKNSFINDAIEEWFKTNPTEQLTKTVLKKLNSEQGASQLTLLILFRHQSKFSLEDAIALHNLDFHTISPTQTYKLLSRYNMQKVFQLIASEVASHINYLELAKSLYLEIIDL
ncbi:MAG: hypothetical protein AAFW70_23775, partial [Cyanobacteria bacterium J06635_10]